MALRHPEIQIEGIGVASENEPNVEVVREASCEEFLELLYASVQPG